MASFNQVNILGNLTRDPELKYAQSGVAICNITLAINERMKRGQDWVDETLFVDVSIFQKSAETCQQYCRKGDPLLISGRLKQDRWEKDGVKHTKLTVVCDRMQLIAGKRDEYDQGPAPDHSQQAPRDRRNDDFEGAF